MARQLAEIQADLARLGSDPSAQYQEERAQLQQELREAEAAQDERLRAYLTARAAVQERIETLEAMAGHIKQGLRPILAMMREYREMEADIEDEVVRLIGEGSDLNTGDGPPRRPAGYVWPRYLEAELRPERP